MGRSTVYNNIVDDDKYKLVNNENKELLEEFIEFLQSTDKSEGTIITYISNIKIFLIWNLENNKNVTFTDLTKRAVMKYQNYLLNTLNHSPSRVRTLRASLSSWSNFIENVLDEDYPDFRNIINKIPAPTKSFVREKTVFQDYEIEQLLQELVAKKRYQQACVLALAWASGSRKSELLRFKVSYFSDENIRFGSLYKTPEKIKTKGRGKAGKQLNRYVLVNKFKPYLELWLKERERLGITNDNLFVNKQGGDLHIATINGWTDKFSDRLGKPFYYHALRHNFTTGLSQAGIPASVIKEIVGWDSLDMVSIYDDTEIDDKLDQFFGEDGIKAVETKTLSSL